MNEITGSKLLKLYAVTGSRQKTAAALGVPTSTANRWIEKAKGNGACVFKKSGKTPPNKIKPDNEILKELFKTKNAAEIAAMYNVKQKTVAKWKSSLNATKRVEKELGLKTADHINASSFIDEHDLAGEFRASRLYAQFSAWCKQNHLLECGRSSFNAIMEDLGHTKITKSKNAYFNIRRCSLPEVYAESKLSQKHIDLAAMDTPRKITEHAAMFYADPEEVEAAIDSAESQGYQAVWLGSRVYLQPNLDILDAMTIDDKIYSGKEYKFGAIGDTHLGSKYARLDCLKEFYSICEQEEVPLIFLAGNMIEGENPRLPGQTNTLVAHGLDGQVQYFIDNYPTYDGVQTMFITGDDHEGWATQQAHINIGHYLEMAARDAGREDLKYIGHMERDVQLKEHTAPIRVAHPGGGSAIAISYRGQKIVDGFNERDDIGMYLCGHYHKAHFLPSYRGVAVLQVGCFQDQTPFMRKKNLAAHVGGWIVTVRFHEETGAMMRIKPEFIKFFDREWYEEERWEYEW